MDSSAVAGVVAVQVRLPARRTRSVPGPRIAQLPSGRRAEHWPGRLATPAQAPVWVRPASCTGSTTVGAGAGEAGTTVAGAAAGSLPTAGAGSLAGDSEQPARRARERVRARKARIGP